MLSPRCPRCGFSFAWNGRKCGHCPPPSRARQIWDTIGRFEEQLNSTTTRTTTQLLAIADGCLRRVWDVLPQNIRDAVEAYAQNPQSVRNLGRLRSTSAADPQMDFANRLRLIRDAAESNSPSSLFWAVAALATTCRVAAGNRDYPPREMLSFPLPADLEPYREVLAGNLDHDGDLVGGHPAGVARAYEHLAEELNRYNQERGRALFIEEAAQCAIIRDTQVYPEVTVVFDPEWRTTTAVALAREMYASRDFSVMPILADALQDAGCEDPEILEHCRSEKPHFRGCWVLEMVLAKA
ncbi:MAG: hypothetical protein U0792_24410 [Gemmataceae bacterium]